MQNERALAMVFRDVDQPFTPQRIELPVLEAGELLIKVGYSTICTSDLHTFHGRRPGPCPSILGHEIMGVIAATGPGDYRDYRGAALSPGDRITWSVYAHDHESEMARKGFPQKSPDLFKYGHEKLKGRYALSGGFATHCILRPGTDLFKLPPQLSPEEAAPLNCTHATMVGALRLAGPLKGKNVLITGAGMLGLSACAMCRVLGAARVWAMDIDRKRNERSLAFGAHGYFPATETTEVLCQAMQVYGGPDLVIDTSGAPSAMEKGIALLNIGGTCVWVGAVSPQRDLAINAETIVRKILTIKGLHNYTPEDLARAIDFLSAHHRQYPFAELVGPVFPLLELSKAFAAADAITAYRVGVFPETAY